VVKRVRARKIAILLLNRSFRIIQANQAAAELSGYMPAELTKLNIRDTWHPADAPFLERNMAVASIGKPSRYRRRFRRADRSYILVDVSMKKLDGGYRVVVCRPVGTSHSAR
jgi:PAS domain S-box-containing protein